MASKQEVHQCYGTDPALQTLSKLQTLCGEVSRCAQRDALEFGEHSKAKAYVNSKAGFLVGSKVAELVFIAALKTGAVVDAQDIERVGREKIPHISGSFDRSDPVVRIAGIAGWNAKKQVEEEIEDAGNRVWSTPVEDLAWRAGVISVRFLESLGADIERDQFLIALDQDDVGDIITGYSTERQVELESRQSLQEDEMMEPVMSMLYSMKK